MGLPDVPLPRDTVVVGDDKVEVRGLSRAEAMRMATMGGDLDAAETFVIAQGVGVSEAEARAWREQTPADVVGVVVDRIAELSGLTEEASKSDRPGSDAGDR